MNEFFLRITLDDDNQPLSDAEYYDKIKRQAVISFNDQDKKEKCNTIAEDENKSFGEIFSCFEGKTLNLRWIRQWPVTSKPYALCAEDGKARSNLKHLFRNKLQQLNPEGILLTSPMDISVSIVDAMRVVRIIKIDDLKPPTFLTWAKNVFSYIEGLPGEKAHIVFDNYVNESTVSLTKGRNESGIQRKISNLNQVLPEPKEWKDFLSNKSNKYQLCYLLADHFTSQTIDTNKNIYVTKGKICFMKNLNQSRVEISELFSNHKEADHRLAFHVQYESNLGRTVCGVADDSDCLLLLLLFTALQCQSTLYFRQGTHKSKDGITYSQCFGTCQFSWRGYL